MKEKLTYQDAKELSNKFNNINDLYSYLLGKVSWGDCQNVVAAFKLLDSKGQMYTAHANWRGYLGSHQIYVKDNIVYDPIMKIKDSLSNYLKKFKVLKLIKRDIKMESYKEKLVKLLESSNLTPEKEKVVKQLYDLWNNSFKEFNINEKPEWDRISPSMFDNSFSLGFFVYYSESLLDKSKPQRGLYELRKIGEKGLDKFKQGLKSIKGKFTVRMQPKIKVEVNGFSNYISIHYMLTVVGSKIKVIFKDKNTGKQYIAGTYKDKFAVESANGRDWFTYVNKDYKTDNYLAQIYMKSKYTTLKVFDNSLDAKKYIDKVEIIYEEVEY